LERIQAASRKKGLVSGRVNVYVLDSQGEPITTMGVSKAMEPENLLPLLRQVVKEKQLTPRAPEAIRATARQPLPAPRPKTADVLVLHVWTRYLPPGETDKGTTDDWFELSASDWIKFLPLKDAGTGVSWQVPTDVAEKLCRYFYPAVCTYDARESKVKKAALTATVSAVSPQETRITLRGDVELDHSRDGTIDGRVTASMVGMVRYDPAVKTITSFQMVSDRARYVWHWQGRANPSRIAIIVENAAPKN
jgi:hypothetical protein